MSEIYDLGGTSRQGHHQALSRAIVVGQKEMEYVGLMMEVRMMHPGMGLRSMYEYLVPQGIGRDAFIALGLRAGLRLSVVSNPVRTTRSVKSRRYCNLLCGRQFTDVNQVWSSDLFYFSLSGTHYYVVLIMDVYSRRIVGYSVANNMRAENNVAALRMALAIRGVANFEGRLIHHSDRGSQYISDDYTDLLEQYGIQISMCNEVYENAHIERANGTIKNGYLKRWNIGNEKMLIRSVHKAIKYYNIRPHQGLQDRMNPMAFEEFISQLNPKQRLKLEIFTSNNQIMNNPNQLEFNFG